MALFWITSEASDLKEAIRGHERISSDKDDEEISNIYLIFFLNLHILSVESNTFLLNGSRPRADTRANFRESIRAKGHRPSLDNLASTLLKKESFSLYKNGQKMVTYKSYILKKHLTFAFLLSSELLWTGQKFKTRQHFLFWKQFLWKRMVGYWIQGQLNWKLFYIWN